jgi:hypothetical protein
MVTLVRFPVLRRMKCYFLGVLNVTVIETISLNVTFVCRFESTVSCERLQRLIGYSVVRMRRTLNMVVRLFISMYE